MWSGFENLVSLVGLCEVSVVISEMVYLLVEKRKWKYPVGFASGNGGLRGLADK